MTPDPSGAASARDLLAEIDATLKLGRERHLDFREQAYELLKRLRPLVEREGGQMRPEQHAISHDATAAVDAPSGPETSEPGSAERPGRASANAVHPPDPRSEARALIERVYTSRSVYGMQGYELGLITHLEAALEREGRKDKVLEQALQVLIRVHRHSDCGCGGNHDCDEMKAIDALYAARREETKP